MTTHAIDPHRSARHIRRRLALLLLQAFGAVVLLTVALLILLLAFFFSRAAQGSAAFTPPLAHALEAYYLGHGSWQGVAAVAQAGSGGLSDQWENTVLLDETGRVLVDHGRTDTPRVGQPYSLAASQPRFPIHSGGRQVGTLAYMSPAGYEPLGLLLSLLPPVAVISFFTGLLTLLIGLLLTRRVVNPLADVIAAARAVAQGDLSARVAVSGPSDLRSLSDSFNRMAGALERSDQERRSLLADVAHELRTPLTVIRGKLEGILDGVYPADEAHVAPVLEETYLLERLVEDLRLLTLVESRQLHFDRRPVDLGDLAVRTAGLFEAEAQEKQISLEVRVEPGLPHVLADPQRVEQAVGNLLSNALRYVPEGSQVAVSVGPSAGGVRLAVSDNGPGVVEADLPHIFDRFWRGEKSRSRAAGGAGLGLAIARQLIEAQEGTIAASLVPGGGLRVEFVLAAAG